MNSHRKVLVVEDSEEMLWATGNVLENAGFEVEGVTNGTDALDMVKRMPDIRLILLNYLLPGRSGVSLIEDFQALGCRAMVIGISALPDVRDDFIGAGAFAFIEKPYDINELVFLCRQALDEAPRNVGLAL
jgi:DNA-binding NtrC family response regulator